jgi:hypothetical protein
MASVRDELERQKISNANALPHYGSFEEHRRQLTQLVAAPASAPHAKEATLCVLGAGNCFDLELRELAEHYAAIHLVDLDGDALARAHARQPKEVQARLRLHGNVDVSGANAALGQWRDLKVRPADLMAFPGQAAQALCRTLNGPFDRVVSACLMSQLLLTLRRVLSDRHPLFGATTLTLTVAHLRALAALTKPSGSALFATDVTSNEIAPLEPANGVDDPRQLLQSLIEQGKVFNALEPSYLAAIAEQDPVLSSWGCLSPPRAVWRWRNGPSRTFLVYASELTPHPG